MNKVKVSKLTLTLPSDRQNVLTRFFDAPRELVFEAFTNPKHIVQWWGPRRNSTTIDKLDLRPGGHWRFVEQAQDGSQYGFRGEFREVMPPAKLVWSFEFEGMPGHVCLQTLILQAHGSRTKMIATIVFDSLEDRDGMLNSGMEAGARESYDRLDELLVQLHRK